MLDGPIDEQPATATVSGDRRGTAQPSGPPMEIGHV
jgi:hypothetical protein